MTDHIEAMARACYGFNQGEWAALPEEHRKAFMGSMILAFAALSETHLIVPLEGLKPVGWMYEIPEAGVRVASSCKQAHEQGWTETPLYTLEGIKP